MFSRIPVLSILVGVCFLVLSTSPAQAAKTKMKLKARSYPVGLILDSSQTESGKLDKTNKPQQLIHLIVNTVKPETWQQNGGRGRITYVPKARSLLVANQTPEVHDEIANLLEALQRRFNLQVILEFRLLAVSEACFERLGINFETVKSADSTNEGQKTTEPNGSPGTIMNPPTLGKAFLTDQQVRQLMEATQGDRRSNIMQAPKLAMLDGQTGTVDITTTQFFLTGMKLDFKDGQMICLPKQEPFKLGLFFTVLPTVSADRKSVRVNLKFKQTELASATVPLVPVQIPMNQVGKAGKEKPEAEMFTLFFQQPQISTLAIDNTTVIPAGQTLVLGGIKNQPEVVVAQESSPPLINKIPYLNRLFRTVGYGRESTSLIIMVTPRIIVAEEEEQVFRGIDEPIPRP